MGGVATEDMISRVVNTDSKEKASHLHPEDIIRNTCVFYDIKPTLLKSSKRDARLVRARQVCMYLLKKDLLLTFAEIGNILGGRDHTTVMHGVEKVENLLGEGRINEDIAGITRLTTSQQLH